VKRLPEMLATFPLTEGMEPEHLELIAGCGRNAAYRPGDYLFREGDSADTFWMVRQGKVALEVYSPRRGALVLETVSDGDVIGWSWIFPPYQYTLDARVIEPMRATAFDGACLREKSERDHDLGYELMKRMAKVFVRRLNASRWQLLDLYGREG
jgi:CRP-like cAMP-binding protein